MFHVDYLSSYYQVSLFTDEELSKHQALVEKQETLYDGQIQMINSAIQYFANLPANLPEVLRQLSEKAQTQPVTKEPSPRRHSTTTAVLVTCNDDTDWCWIFAFAWYVLFDLFSAVK